VIGVVVAVGLQLLEGARHLDEGLNQGDVVGVARAEQQYAGAALIIHQAMDLGRRPPLKRPMLWKKSPFSARRQAVREDGKWPARLAGQHGDHWIVRRWSIARGSAAALADSLLSWCRPNLGLRRKS